MKISEMTPMHHQAPCDSYGWNHPYQVSASEQRMTFSLGGNHDSPHALILRLNFSVKIAGVNMYGFKKLARPNQNAHWESVTK